jgi:hypothetical protein
MRCLRSPVAAACSIAASAIVMAGCGIEFPTQPVRGTATATTPVNEVATPPGRPEQVAARTAAGSLHASPGATLRSFAQAYINWDSDDVARRLEALARVSVGQARSELELEAAETASDQELRRGGVGNAGTVAAIAPLPGGGGQYVVVTREQTTATNTSAYVGLGPEWHLTIATVTRVPVVGRRGARRWAVSYWQPES